MAEGRSGSVFLSAFFRKISCLYIYQLIVSFYFGGYDEHYWEDYDSLLGFVCVLGVKEKGRVSGKGRIYSFLFASQKPQIWLNSKRIKQMFGGF